MDKFTSVLPPSVIVLLERIQGLVQRYSKVLWWLHSGYALLLGIFVMWLGSHNFAFLRWVIFPLSFIWLSSLFLPMLSRSPRLTPPWRERLRLVVNYFNKNFYQQMLFFLLPIYYSSATFGSRNMLFVVLLACSALLSTLDLFYDHYISVYRPLTVLFFNFNLFACINVMLPVLWGIGNYWALWISVVFTVAGFVSFFWQAQGWHHQPSRELIGVVVLGLMVFVVLFRSFIPPAPLKLTSIQFGKGVTGLEIVSPLETLPEGWSGKVSVVTAIKAPNGLRERVRHRWFLNGQLIYEQDLKEIVGGRDRGFRLWSRVPWRAEQHGGTLVLDVVTGGGQLIGSATLRSSS